MNRSINSEYANKLKMNAIVEYILDNGENFDYFELAQIMEMTYKQLRIEMQKLIDKKILVIRNDVIQVSIITKTISENRKKNIVQNISDSDIIEDSTNYIPLRFSEKFKGYGLEGGICQ